MERGHGGAGISDSNKSFFPVSCACGDTTGFSSIATQISYDQACSGHADRSPIAGATSNVETRHFGRKASPGAGDHDVSSAH
ncbi:MAG TPA: hypothetical protein VGR71_11520 [Nitrospira sp.]|nr:hypothetical protein [Nitrospira sp.]